jgi:hypothetical protein
MKNHCHKCQRDYHEALMDCPLCNIGLVDRSVESKRDAWQPPKSILDFEALCREEYRQELDSCDRWINWCEKQGDTHGMNFYQGMRSAHVFNNIKTEVLIRILKREASNCTPPAD